MLRRVGVGAWTAAGWWVWLSRVTPSRAIASFASNWKWYDATSARARIAVPRRISPALGAGVAAPAGPAVGVRVGAGVGGSVGLGVPVAIGVGVVAGALFWPKSSTFPSDAEQAFVDLDRSYLRRDYPNLTEEEIDAKLVELRR